MRIENNLDGLLQISKFTKYSHTNSFTVNTEFDIVYEH
jgi:hypothetical protein